MKQLLFTFTITSMLLFLSSCGNSEKPISTDVVNNPKSASSTKEGSVPMLTFDKNEHDFGIAMQGERLSYSFKFTNTGKKDLIISQTSASCGCTVADFPQTPIHPNGKGHVTIVFDTKGLKGLQTKSVVVYANTNPNQVNLRVSAMVDIP
ncbi:MAG: DUF1573 domain-containing protein [Bacteroidales bacterium]|nr:DUF1573 domain-containing protein [Bacteroidales bacterium]MDD4575782.1 DUF1573 domain-containing protein [Bacteroidales bacterium]